jgi:hypothetical protein
VVNSRFGRGGKLSVWSSWKTVGLDVLVNSRIGRGAKHSD